MHLTSRFLSQIWKKSCQSSLRPPTKRVPTRGSTEATRFNVLNSLYLGAAGFTPILFPASTMSPPSIRHEGKWVRRLKQGLGCAFPSLFLTITLSIAATAFPSLEQASLPHDLSRGGDDENPIALSCKSSSDTRIFNEHTKENCDSDWRPNNLRPRTVGGHSNGPASDVRPLLRQWSARCR